MKAHWHFPFVWALFSPLIALCQDNRTGHISGRVEDPVSSSIAGASVTLISLDRIRQTISTSDGGFQFGHLELVAYVIEITAQGFAKRTIPVTLRPTQAQETVAVALNVGNECSHDFSVRYQGVDANGPNLTGTLRDYFSHKQISQAEISIVGEADRQSTIIIRSDRNGRFAVSKLAPDYYDIHISYKGYEKEELKHVAIPCENKVFVESTLMRRNQIVVCQ